MELLSFNKETMPSGRQKKASQPTLTIANAGGKLRFNPKAVELLGITEDSRYAMAHEKGNAKNWFVYEDNKQGYPFVACKGGAMAITNKRLVEHLRECLSVKHPAAIVVPIANEPTMSNSGGAIKLWALLTSAMKQ